MLLRRFYKTFVESLENACLIGETLTKPTNSPEQIANFLKQNIILKSTINLIICEISYNYWKITLTRKYLK